MYGNKKNMKKITNVDNIFREAYTEYITALQCSYDYQWINTSLMNTKVGDPKRKVLCEMRKNAETQIEYDIACKYNISNVSYYGNDV